MGKGFRESQECGIRTHDLYKLPKISDPIQTTVRGIIWVYGANNFSLNFVPACEKIKPRILHLIVLRLIQPPYGFPHYHRHHASTPDIKRVIQGGIEPLSFAHGPQVATCVSLRQFQFATLKLLEVYTLPKPYQVVPH